MNLRSDLPIKYYLNVHQYEDLQDDLGVLFDISQYLLRVIEMKNKELDPQKLKFSSKTLKYVFGDRLQDETFKLNLVKRLRSLIASDFISVTGDEMLITNKGILTFYTIP